MLRLITAVWELILHFQIRDWKRLVSALTEISIVPATEYLANHTTNLMKIKTSLTAQNGSALNNFSEWSPGYTIGKILKSPDPNKCIYIFVHIYILVYNIIFNMKIWFTFPWFLWFRTSQRRHLPGSEVSSMAFTIQKCPQFFFFGALVHF